LEKRHRNLMSLPLHRLEVLGKFFDVLDCQFRVFGIPRREWNFDTVVGAALLGDFPGQAVCQVVPTTVQGSQTLYVPRENAVLVWLILVDGSGDLFQSCNSYVEGARDPFPGWDVRQANSQTSMIRWSIIAQ